MEKNFFQKNILYISRTSKLTGAELTLLDIIQNLNREKYFQNIALPDNKGEFFKKLKSAGKNVFVIYMPFLQVSKNPFKILWFIFNIIKINFIFLKYIKKNKINIVFCNSFQDTIYIFISVFFLKNVKLIVYIKNILSNVLKKKIRAYWLSFFADRIIAVSKKAAGDYINFNVRKEKIEVVYDGISCEQYELKNIINTPNQKDTLNKKVFYLLNIGNLTPIKGQDLLIQTLSSSILKEYDFKAYILGDIYHESEFWYKQKLIKMINEKHISSKVFLLGYKSDVKYYFCNSDIFIHCPVIDDAFPRVILEAMCFGKIIIATSVGGIPEIIEDGFNGYLVKPNVEELTEKIYYVFNNIEKIRFVGLNAKKTVKEKFSLENQISKIERIFDLC